MDDELKHAIFLYLRGDAGPPSDDTAMMRRSSFGALLKDARGAAGRDIETGDVVDAERSSSWLAAMGYLCWFDQIGRAVRLVGGGSKQNGVHACLKQFSSLSVADQGALKGLRNAFTHSYGLVCKGPKGQFYVFALNVNGPLVVHPASPWDGTFPAGHEHTTTIGMRALGDLAETVKDSVLKAHSEERITTSLSAEELSDRYLFEYAR